MVECMPVGGACMQGGMHGRRCVVGGHACTPLPRQILRDTVNERAVRILLECILVLKMWAWHITLLEQFNGLGNQYLVENC